MNNERKVAWLAGMSHLFTHGYMTLLPAVLVVLAGEQSLGFFALGAIVNVGYFLFGLGSIPAGILSDRVGPKRMLTVGLLAMAVSSLLVGIAPNSWTFALCYSMLGLSASIYHPAGLSLIARHIEKKGKALSLHGILGNIGLSVAPLFAGFMVMLFDTWRAAYLSFGLLGLLFTLVVHKSGIAEEKGLSFAEILSPKNWKNRRPVAATDPAGAAAVLETSTVPLSLLLLYLGSIFFGFIYRGSLTFFPALFQQDVAFVSGSEQPVVIAGLVTSIILSVGIFGQWLGGYLSDRAKRPEAVHIAIYSLVIPAAYGIGRLTDSWLIAASVVFSLVFYGWQPIQNSLIARYATKSSYGKGYGLNFFFIMGMGSLATAIGGYVADDKGVDTVYVLLALVSVLALLVSVAVVRCGRYSIRYGFSVEKE